ncbi:MAG: glutamine-hydrolyzing GMP synthase, partial [Spirochaetes bacterium]|nr:glutamine-hydrolyzing GMP synthase [Spirochaetota bacterium]
MNKILVLDFGGQYAHLIAKQLRRLGYYSEIALPSIETEQISSDTKGIILSGGPSSVYQAEKPDFNEKLLQLDLPILGLCYGHHAIIQHYGGSVGKAKKGEYGFTIFNKVIDSQLFQDIEFPAQVWMSHEDEVSNLPEDFEISGATENCQVAAYENILLKRYGLQFHAEVKDTLIGGQLFQNFAKICGMKKNWDQKQVLQIIKQQIKNESKDKKVILFLSGGVDSSVAFALLNEVLGTERVLGLFIDNGFLRKNERERIQQKYHNLGYDNFIIEGAEEEFLTAVGHETDPQKKRKIIGETFIKIRDKVVNRLGICEDQWLLGQGTLYPDIIESGGSKHAKVIKTHHNRVEGIKKKKKKGLIIEPLKDLYKDEVRELGKQLGLPDNIVYRHPFPGPGISINLLCSDGKIIDNEKFALAEKKIKKIDLTQWIASQNYQ